MKLLAIIFTLSFIVGCSVESKVNSQPIEEQDTTKKITTLQDSSYWTYMRLMHYEGHDYIVNSRGGVIHSESCKCKGGVK